MFHHQVKDNPRRVIKPNTLYLHVLNTLQCEVDVCRFDVKHLRFSSSTCKADTKKLISTILFWRWSKVIGSYSNGLFIPFHRNFPTFHFFVFLQAKMCSHSHTTAHINSNLVSNTIERCLFDSWLKTYSHRGHCMSLSTSSSTYVSIAGGN